MLLKHEFHCCCTGVLPTIFPALFFLFQSTKCLIEPAVHFITQYESVILYTGACGYGQALHSGQLQRLINRYDVLDIITQILMPTTGANLIKQMPPFCLECPSSNNRRPLSL